MVEESELDAAEELRAAVGDFVRRVREHDTMPTNQAHVLGHLGRDGDLSITELAERERVRHQSMARTVKLMTGLGLLDPVEDVQDRRRMAIRLTAAGRARLAQLRHERADRIAHAVRDQLDPDEQRALRRIPAILKKLALEQEFDQSVPITGRSLTGR